MLRLWLPILAMVCSYPAPTEAQHAYWINRLFQCTTKECVVRYNQGGLIWTFELAAREAIEGHISFRIDGICNSSCVLFASRVRENVCITNNARMGVHMGSIKRVFDHNGQEVSPSFVGNLEIFAFPPAGYRVDFERYVEMNYGQDINEWAAKNAKMPASQGVYVLTHSEALQFWRACT